MKLLSIVVMALGLVSQSVDAAEVDSYPSKPIRLIVPFAPAGSNDLLGRVLGQKLNEAWHQPAIIDNRPGGGSTIGIETVVRAAPDGYTLLITSGGIAINVSLYKLSFNPVKDLAPIALLAQMPYLVAVNPSVPAKNIAELIAVAKAQPGKLTFASSGIGTSSHLMGEMFRTQAKIDMLHIAFKGGGPAVNSVISGEVKVLFNVITGVLPMVRAGKLKGLAVSSKQRAAVAPEVPTIAESGIAGFDVIAWYNLFAPARTPKPIVNKLNAEINRILQQSDTRTRFLGLGVEPMSGSPEALGDYLQFEIKRWAKLIKDADIRAE
jgi:tripartite-type tricarboxylate transporter receptor subunit TctC